MTMAKNEAQARIKINRYLETAGWRFEETTDGPANIELESGVKFSELGDDLENAISRSGTRGAIDFLLLDKDKRPLVVVEAKKESIDPLSAKEQARNYARNIGARFIILSNGNIHYLWDTKHGNPETISRFPTQESITQYEKYLPNPDDLVSSQVDENYIIATQFPNFLNDPDFKNADKRATFLKKNNLKQMRPYQVQAIRAIQEAAKAGSQRFLFEMATGTGKTLVSAAVIKLFLKSGNAKRVLFLVDRLELEDQAQKAFIQYLGKDFRSVIYKSNKDSWSTAEIVVSTVQTFLAGDRYKKDFSPTDFELVISDEAHRSIGGNSRAVFEYFVGYKLGLTATPKNYLKGLDVDDLNNQRDFERRLLVDTYKTFGCEPGHPTFSYDLERGANEGFLIKPTLVDARTEVTTQLLSDDGYSVRIINKDGDEIEESFTQRDFEKKVFNDETNIAMCRTLLDYGLFDPAAIELGVPLFGKSIVFAVSQRHAARLTNILNKLALERWPDSYGQSDFAMQITSDVSDAQQMTINFANNRLGGQVENPIGYESSKTRVAVTVGMMTTGYDCQDLLNIALMRPVFSPSDFVQMKGRGTRRWSFSYDNYVDIDTSVEKNHYKFFDFFATCEYFENEFDYDQKIKLPVGPPGGPGGKVPGTPTIEVGSVDLATSDQIASLTETPEGVIMRIDREGFKKAVAEDITSNATLNALWENGDYEAAEEFVKFHILDKPNNFLNLERIRKAFGVDRRISVREFLQVAFGERDDFESKDSLLESEWERFMEIHKVDQDHYSPVKNFFKAFIVDEEVRDIVKSKQLARFHHCASFDFDDYERLNDFKRVVPQYVYDYAYQLTGI
jgi:type I restriction enzyme, R subunit